MRNLASSQYREVRDGSETWSLLDQGIGPAVVMYHGFPNTPRSLDRVADSLQMAGYRTIRPYLPGYTATTNTSAPSFAADALATNCERLLDVLELESASILGHDWGAVVGYALADVSPHRVDALVAVSVLQPDVFPRTPTVLWANRHFLHFLLPFASERTRRNNFAYIERLTRRFSSGSDAQRVKNEVRQARDLLADASVLHAAIAYYRDSMRQRPSGRSGSPIHVPHLLMVGDRELHGLGGMTAVERSLQRFEPTGQLTIVPSAAHSPHIDNTSAFMEALLAFLADTTLR